MRKVVNSLLAWLPTNYRMYIKLLDGNEGIDPITYQEKESEEEEGSGSENTSEKDTDK